MTLIRESYTDFVALCLSYKVGKIYAFRSRIKDHCDPLTSDIDIVVTIDMEDPTDRGEVLLLLLDRLKFF